MQEKAKRSFLYTLPIHGCLTARAKCVQTEQALSEKLDGSGIYPVLEFSFGYCGPTAVAIPICTLINKFALATPLLIAGAIYEDFTGGWLGDSWGNLLERWGTLLTPLKDSATRDPLQVGPANRVSINGGLGDC